MLERLRLWGAGLSDDVRDEVRAAGRAILLLVAEIERLQVDRWNERAGVSGSLLDDPSEPAAAAVDARGSEDGAGGEIEGPLWRRIRLKRGSASSVE
jgi:hypothetical protein